VVGNLHQAGNDTWNSKTKRSKRKKMSSSTRMGKKSCGPIASFLVFESIPLMKGMSTRDILKSRRPG
jgi:hypothetical protein